MVTQAGNNTSPTKSSPNGRVLSMFWQKMEGLNPQTMDNKVPIPTRTYCSATKSNYISSSKIGKYEYLQVGL